MKLKEKKKIAVVNKFCSTTSIYADCQTYLTAKKERNVIPTEKKKTSLKKVTFISMH